MTGVSVAASVLTIMALSVERYLAIRHPVILRHVLTASRLRSVVVLIWSLSVCVMLPLTVVRSVDHYQLLAVGHMITVCHEHWPRTVSLTVISTSITIACHGYSWAVEVSSRRLRD